MLLFTVPWPKKNLVLLAADPVLNVIRVYYTDLIGRALPSASHYSAPNDCDEHYSKTCNGHKCNHSVDTVLGRSIAKVITLYLIYTILTAYEVLKANGSHHRFDSSVNSGFRLGLYDTVSMRIISHTYEYAAIQYHEGGSDAIRFDRAVVLWKIIRMMQIADSLRIGDTCS